MSNQTGKMTSTMNISEFISILENVKKRYGNLPVWGECEDCGTIDMDVWVLTAANEMNAVIIQVSSRNLEE